jgi:Antitoxin FitA-like, ribbon-helix-helix/Clp amino terminal domain, pathogenicity island component
MATLHVRNVPDELYELLRERAAANGRSIGAETCQLIYERLVVAAGRPRAFPLPSLRRRPVGPPGAFTRFTPEARKVVVTAQEEARALGHDHVGIDHLLLGVLAQNPQATDVTTEEVRARLRPGDATTTGQIPFTPDAKRALELALRAALRLGDPLIEPRHLVVGIRSAEEDEADLVQTNPIDPAIRVVLLEGEPEDWERQLNETSALGYELVQIVDRRAIFRR